MAAAALGDSKKAKLGAVLVLVLIVFQRPILQLSLLSLRSFGCEVVAWVACWWCYGLLAFFWYTPVCVTVASIRRSSLACTIASPPLRRCARGQAVDRREAD